jgi:hypothetical protein
MIKSARAAIESVDTEYEIALASWARGIRSSHMPPLAGSVNLAASFEFCQSVREFEQLMLVETFR